MNNFTTMYKENRTLTVHGRKIVFFVPVVLEYCEGHIQELQAKVSSFMDVSVMSAEWFKEYREALQPLLDAIDLIEYDIVSWCRHNANVDASTMCSGSQYCFIKNNIMRLEVAIKNNEYVQTMDKFLRQSEIELSKIRPFHIT